jgi:hypothetical protein
MEIQKTTSMIQKVLSYIGVVFLAILIGMWLGKQFFVPDVKVEENSNVVIEKIEKVAKLITVEAQLSEIYNYKDYYDYDFSFLRKKILLRINAKVSAGYDLKKMNIKVDAKERVIKVGPIPPPQILSVDHTVDYFNIEEGLFNSFTPEDYTKINAKAKDYITKVASNNEVLKTAKLQENTMIEMMSAMSKSMGYKLEIVNSSIQK